MDFLADKVKIIGAVLLCVAFSSSALTLGRVRGAALVGHPLDVLVPVQMEAGEDASILCFDADVFHADTRQDASRVRVRIETSSQPNSANVRVMSSSIVDEPVVTVYLRTGCGQKTTRRYVLLADLPSEVAAPSVPRVTPLTALPTTVAQAGATTTTATTAPVSVAQEKPPRLRKKTARKAVDTPPPIAKTALAPPRPKGQSRLKLDPLELLSDRVANLDSFMTFEPPEDAVRSGQRIQTLEATVKAGLALAAKNEASLTDLKTRLQKAESDQYPAVLLYGLIALVLACLAAVAFLWNRQRHSQTDGSDWWSASAEEPDAMETRQPESVPSTKSVEPSKQPEAKQATGKASVAALSQLMQLPFTSSHVDVNLTEMSESTFGDFMQSVDEVNVGRQSLQSASTSAELRPKPAASFNSDAILDIRQQADFFVSLGQTDRAVRILKKKIEESEVPNPILYLDLLEIFHSLGLKNEFQQFRMDFNLLFTGKVPEFASFKNEGESLESYPDVLSRITALWPTPKVLAEIESFIFRDPRIDMSQAFELAAFRELLLLHSLIQSIAIAPTPEGSESKPDSLQVAAMPLIGTLDLNFSNGKTERPTSSSDDPWDDMRRFKRENPIDFAVSKSKLKY